MAMNLFGNFNFGNISGIVIIILLIVLGLAGLFFIFYTMWKQKQYKHCVIINKQAKGNRSLKYVDWAREIKKNGTVVNWHLKRTKKLTTIPDDDAIDLTTKGGFMCAASIDTKGQLSWLKNTYDFDDEKRQDTYERLSTESKANYAYQQQMNKKLRGFDFWSQASPLIISGFILIIAIVAMGLVFNKLAPKIESAHDARNQGLKIQENILDKLIQIETGQADLEKSITEQSDSGELEAAP